jgi:quinol monooxygenase YgiN
MSSENKPTLFAKFTAADGRFDELLTRLQTLVPVAERDPGVEVYRLHATDDRTAIWFYEVYADDRAAEAHRADPALHEVLGASQELIADTEIVAGRLLGQKA